MMDTPLQPVLKHDVTRSLPSFCDQIDRHQLRESGRVHSHHSILTIRDMAYPARLRALDLPSLVHRRKRADKVTDVQNNNRH